MDNTMLIAIAEARPAVKAAADKPLEERLRISMKEMLNHWCVTEEDKQFRSAIGAVMLEASEGEKERLKKELQALRNLSALVDGVPLDFERIEKIENPLQLTRIWQEVKGAPR